MKNTNALLLTKISIMERIICYTSQEATGMRDGDTYYPIFKYHNYNAYIF